jgi:hypothetical protein
MQVHVEAALSELRISSNLQLNTVVQMELYSILKYILILDLQASVRGSSQTQVHFDLTYCYY